MCKFVCKLILGISILIVNLIKACPKHFICGFLIHAFEKMFLIAFHFSLSHTHVSKGL